ncbi:tRNA-dihydrouridine(20) synthase [NAD(P)+]-like [Terramyces sp. JEL0728]|nr:tRNA-dihydrouridine(20) synthase [NAD(P)+]-like [Terramyces sp. JEL0728]
MEYRGKHILAPMVRVGTLPMRLLALKYGAELLGTIDYIDDSGNGGLVLRIHPKEQSKLVLQLGSADPELAVQAALKLQNDVSAVDLNCGCPKKFSLHSGMGANLLRTPDKLCAILEALIANLSIPVTCKIRLLDATADQTTEERTIELLQKIEKTGVKAIGVHCRYTHERPRQPGHWDVFEKLAPSIRIPLIANGDIYSLEDVHKLKSSFGKGT